MTRLELITHPIIESAKNSYKELILILKPSASIESRNSLIKKLTQELECDASIYGDKVIFDTPLKTDLKKKVWFKITNGIVERLTDNIKKAVSFDKIEDQFDENEMAIGIDINDFFLDFNMYDDKRYSWAFKMDNGDIDFMGVLPSERVSYDEVMQEVLRINNITDIKIIGIKAIIG